MSVPSRQELLKVAKEHLEVANAGAARRPRPVRTMAYLAHVAAECAIKARILTMNARERTSDLREVLEVHIYEQTFESSHGHNLKHLATISSLKRLLVADRKAALLQGESWRRMCDDDRPYSLRYGTKKLAPSQAEDEVRLVETILGVIDRDAT